MLGKSNLKTPVSGRFTTCTGGVDNSLHRRASSGARATEISRVFSVALVSFMLAGCVVKPKPLTDNELLVAAESNLSRVTANQEPVGQSVTLYEAMARALKYNLDHQVELMSRSLADRKLVAARADMLPDLIANADYSRRNNDAYSYSRSLGGVRSGSPTTSDARNSFTSDLSFSWNILDFGLSYVRAKQAANKALIAEEQKRKVVNQIVADVRTAFWRAASSERLLKGFQRLEARVNSALKSSRALGQSGYTSPAAALTYQRELVDIKGQIQELERGLRTAKIQLAALMNVKPNEHYHLVIPKRNIRGLSVQLPIDEMMLIALRNRPEIRELAYTSRITKQEAKAAKLELLPGIQLFAGANTDTNDLLVNANWINVGAKATWNLMRLVAYPSRKGVVDAQEALNDKRTLAMTMAVLTQVQVSVLRYGLLRKSAATASEYYRIQRKLLKHIRASSDTGATSEQTLIREEMNALVSSVKYDIAYSDLQNAFASIYTSVGLDPWGDYLDLDQSINGIATNLRKTWRGRGDLGS